MLEFAGNKGSIPVASTTLACVGHKQAVGFGRRFAAAASVKNTSRYPGFTVPWRRFKSHHLETAYVPVLKWAGFPVREVAIPLGLLLNGLNTLLALIRPACPRRSRGQPY